VLLGTPSFPRLGGASPPVQSTVRILLAASRSRSDRPKKFQRSTEISGLRDETAPVTAERYVRNTTAESGKFSVKIRNELRQLVSEEPGLSSNDLFNSLSEVARPSTGIAVLTHLYAMERRGEVHARLGLWYPGPGSVTPIVAASSPSKVAPVAASDQNVSTPIKDDGDVGVLEREIRHRLRGRRLIAEVGLDSRLFEATTDAVEDALPRLGLRGVARTYPYVFMTFMVGHGVYGYEAGTYWGRMPIGGVDNDAGPMFAARCRDYGFEDFSDLLASERAQRYLAPILAHGGIPKYSLDDFFAVLLRAIRQVGAQPEDVLSYFRSRSSAFANIDKPVARFLLYGGDVSFDFLARCIEAVIFVQRHGRPPTPEDSGLPPYVLVWLGTERDEVRRSTPGRGTSSSTVRPRLVLDPYSPLGPQLSLPTIPRALSESWRLSSAEGVVRRKASGFEPEMLGLSPQKSWTVELLSNETSTREWTFEGLDEAPMLLFDPFTDELIPSSTSVRLESVWMVAPHSAQIDSVLDRGEASSAEMLEEAAGLTGDWSGYCARHVSLAGCSELRVQDGIHAARVLVRPVASRPRIQGELVDGVTTEDGLPVYRGAVTVVLPADSGLEASQWVVRRSIDGREPERVAVGADFRSEVISAEGLLASSISVSVHGALGSDLRLSFALVPGLTLRTPEHLLLPGAKRPVVTVSAPGLLIGEEVDRADLDIAETDDALDFVVSDGVASVPLRVRVPKLMWATVESASAALSFSSRPTIATMRQLVDGELLALTVRVGRAEISLELHLLVDGKTIQVSDRVKSGRAEGRWTFDLAPFRDAIRTSDSSSATFVLRVGQVPVTVLRLRAEVDVTDLEVVGRVVGDFASVHVTFGCTTAQRDRVFRLWSIDRPWEPPVQGEVPDESNEAEIHGYELLREGRYLAEIIVDDGWTQPACPRLGPSNVAEIRLGSAESQEDALLARSNSDPLVVLESALLTGRLRRPLEDDELDELAPAAMTAVRWFLLRPDPLLSVPRGIERVLHVLTLRPRTLASAVNAEAELGRLDRAAATRLTLAALRHRYELPEDEAGTDEELRRLWSSAPGIAALLDFVPACSNDREHRLADALGWSPETGTDVIFAGEPVDQMTAGPSPEQLRAIRSMMDLLPKSLLAADALVEANFDWLIRAKEDEVDLDGFWWTWSRRMPGKCTNPLVMHHLERRTAPQGAYSWASLPRLTLTAAALATTPTETSLRGDGLDLLDEAAGFAPRLVERDLVLARALNVYAPPDEETDQ
jgi:hypothetical protein